MDSTEVIAIPSAPVDGGPTDEEKQGCADSLEALMLEVQNDEANWQLDDRLDWLRAHGA